MKSIVSAFLLTFLAGCVSTPPDPAISILGSWQSEVGGFSIVTTYAENEVTVDGFEPRAYSLEGDTLVIEGDQISSRTVSFPSSSEMIQIDNITDTTHSYTRIDG